MVSLIWNAFCIPEKCLAPCIHYARKKICSCYLVWSEEFCCQKKVQFHSLIEPRSASPISGNAAMLTNSLSNMVLCWISAGSPEHVVLKFQLAMQRVVVHFVCMQGFQSDCWDESISFSSQVVEEQQHCIVWRLLSLRKSITVQWNTIISPTTITSSVVPACYNVINVPSSFGAMRMGMVCEDLGLRRYQYPAPGLDERV